MASEIYQVPIDPEKMNRLARMPSEEESKELEAISTTTIKHPWFTGLKALMDMFSERVPFQERVRIVVDYDPQQTHTKIVIYRPKGTLTQAEDQL